MLPCGVPSSSGFHRCSWPTHNTHTHVYEEEKLSKVMFASTIDVHSRDLDNYLQYVHCSRWHISSRKYILPIDLFENFKEN